MPGDKKETYKNGTEEGFMEEFYTTLQNAKETEKAESYELSAADGGDYEQFLERQKKLENAPNTYGDDWPAHADLSFAQENKALFDKKLLNQLLTPEEQMTLVNKGLYWWDVVRIDGDTFINHLARKYNEQIRLAQSHKSTYSYVFEMGPDGEPRVRNYTLDIERSSQASLFKSLMEIMHYDNIANEMAILMIKGKNKIEVPDLKTFDRGNVNENQKERMSAYYEKQLRRNSKLRDKMVQLYKEGHNGKEPVFGKDTPQEEKDRVLIDNVINRVEDFSQFSDNNLFYVNDMKRVQVNLTKDHEKIERKTWGPLKRFGNWVARLWGRGKTQKEKQEYAWQNDTNRQERVEKEKQELSETVEDRVWNLDEVIRREKQFMDDLKQMTEDQSKANMEYLNAVRNAREDSAQNYFVFQKEAEIESYNKLAHEVFEQMEKSRNMPTEQFIFLKNRMSYHMAEAQRYANYFSARNELNAITAQVEKHMVEMKNLLITDLMANGDDGTLVEEMRDTKIDTSDLDNVRKNLAYFKIVGGVGMRQTVEGMRDYWFARANDPKRTMPAMHIKAMRRGLISERSLLLAAKEALMTATLNGAMSIAGNDKNNSIMQAINSVAGKEREQLILQNAGSLLNKEQQEKLLAQFAKLNTQIEKYEKALHAFSMNGSYVTTSGQRVWLLPFQYDEFLRRNTEGLSLTTGLEALGEVQNMMQEAIDKKFEDLIKNSNLPDKNSPDFENRLKSEMSAHLAAARLCGKCSEKAKERIDTSDMAGATYKMMLDFEDIPLPSYAEGSADGLIRQNAKFDAIIENQMKKFDEEPKQVLHRHIDNLQLSMLKNISFGNIDSAVHEVGGIITAWKNKQLGANQVVAGLINMREQYENLGRPAKDFALATADISFAIEKMKELDASPDMIMAGFEHLMDLEINTSWDPSEPYVVEHKDYRRMTINEAEMRDKKLLNEEEMKKYQECKATIKNWIDTYKKSEEKDPEFFSKQENFEQVLEDMRQLTLTAILRHEKFKALGGVLVTLGDSSKFYNGEQVVQATQNGMTPEILKQILGQNNLQRVARQAFNNTMCMANLCTELLREYPTDDAQKAIKEWDDKQKHMSFKKYGNAIETLNLMMSMEGMSTFQIAEQAFARTNGKFIDERAAGVIERYVKKQEDVVELSLEDKKEYARFEQECIDNGNPVSGAKTGINHMIDKIKQAEYLMNYQHLNNILNSANGLFDMKEAATKMYGMFQALTSFETLHPGIKMSDLDLVRDGMISEKIGPDFLDEKDREEYLQCVESIKASIAEMEKEKSLEKVDTLVTEDMKKVWSRFCELTRKCVDSMPVFKDSGAIECVGKNNRVDISKKFKEVSSAAVMYERAARSIILDTSEKNHTVNVFDYQAMVDQKAIKECENLFSKMILDDKLGKFTTTTSHDTSIDMMTDMDKIRALIKNEKVQMNALKKVQQVDALNKKLKETANELSTKIGKEELMQKLSAVDANQKLSPEKKEAEKKKIQGNYTKQFNKVTDAYKTYVGVCAEMDQKTDFQDIESQYNKVAKYLDEKDRLPDINKRLMEVEKRALADAFKKIFPGEEQDPRCAIFADKLNLEAFKNMDLKGLKKLLHSDEKTIKEKVKDPKTGNLVTQTVKKELGADLDKYIKNFVEADGDTYKHKSYVIKLGNDKIICDRYSYNPVRDMLLNVEKYVMKEVEMEKAKIAEQCKEKYKDGLLKKVQSGYKASTDKNYLELMALNNKMKTQKEQADAELTAAVKAVQELNMEVMNQESLDNQIAKFENEKALKANAQGNKVAGDKKIAGDDKVAGDKKEAGDDKIAGDKKDLGDQNKPEITEEVAVL